MTPIPQPSSLNQFLHKSSAENYLIQTPMQE